MASGGYSKRARYRDEAGKEHAKHFPRKIDAQRWLDDVSASVVAGTYVDPKTALTTVQEWSVVWLKGYENTGRLPFARRRHT
jgi:hypothetical protein